MPFYGKKRTILDPPQTINACRPAPTCWSASSSTGRSIVKGAYRLRQSSVASSAVGPFPTGEYATRVGQEARGPLGKGVRLSRDYSAALRDAFLLLMA